MPLADWVDPSLKIVVQHIISTLVIEGGLGVVDWLGDHVLPPGPPPGKWFDCRWGTPYLEPKQES
jgi:hypothetical protein